jgi:mannosyltransferase OCH1-like enzyme
MLENQPIKESFELFKKNLLNNENVIPKVIYRTAAYDMLCLPHMIWDLYRKEKEINSNYEYFYFDDWQCEAYILTAYGSYIRDLYLKLLPTAFRADFFRYLLLYDKGGIYMDFTQHSVMPMDYIIKDYKEVYVSDYYTFNDETPKVALYNAFIATVKGTKLLELAINKCIEHIETEFYGRHTLDITGPAMLGKAFRYLKIDGAEDDVYINAGKINDDFCVLNYDKKKYGECIVDEDTSEILLKNKIDYHYRLMYNGKNKDKRYPLLYDERRVYDKQIQVNRPIGYSVLR